MYRQLVKITLKIGDTNVTSSSLMTRIPPLKELNAMACSGTCHLSSMKFENFYSA